MLQCSRPAEGVGFYFQHLVLTSPELEQTQMKVLVHLAAHHSASICIPWIVTVVWSKTTLCSENLGAVKGNVSLSVQSLQARLA